MLIFIHELQSIYLLEVPTMVHITLYFEGFIITFAHKWIKLVALQVDLNPSENSTFSYLNNVCDEVLLIQYRYSTFLGVNKSVRCAYTVLTVKGPL